MVNQNIDLTAIKESGRAFQGKNGRWYANITVAEKKEPDQYGNDCTVYLSQNKDERDAKTAKVYIGSGKSVKFEKTPINVPVQTLEKAPPPQEKEGDLPF